MLGQHKERAPKATVGKLNPQGEPLLGQPYLADSPSYKFFPSRI
jgi:hypothetical protein